MYKRQPREFSRKDGSVGRVASFLFEDGSQKIKIILWDDKVDLVKNEYFRVNELIRIIGGYCKKGRNDKLEVYLGKRGKVILSPEISNKKLKLQLDSIEENIPSETISKNDSSVRINDLVERFNYITRIQGQVQIDIFKEITKKSGDKTFLLKLILSDDSATIRIIIWGIFAVECLKLINDNDTIVISNVSVKRNKFTNEKELVFTKNSTLEIVQ